MRIERLERDKAKLIEERDHWKRRSEHLEKELEAARRAGRRQAAPFAKDRPQGRGGRPGRRAGAEYGRQGRRRPPTQADETHVAPAPTSCPDCGGAVALDRVASQYQEDLPEVRPLVRRFDIEVGHCSQCQRRVQGRHALQTSDALGAAAAQLGPNVAALVVELHTELGMPLEKVVRVLRTQFGLSVTKGGLVQLLHRTADAAAPAYAALREQVRCSPVVTPDETGWRVNAILHWLWAFATPETTVYAICDGRGFAEAAAVLGPDFAGVLVRDGWVAYRGFKKAPHQTCLAHLLRRCKDLQAAHPDSPWAGAVQAVLRDGLALRDRSNAGEISEHGLASARGRLAARLGRLIDTAPPLAAAERFAKHLANEFPAVFLFLCDPSIDATNWRAEQAIRPAVVTRKVCGGNRTRRGADTQQVLASVVRTARQRNLDPRSLITTMLCAPEPVVPEALCVAAARLTPGGVETAHPLPVLLRAPGPHSIRAVPPPPEPATRGFRRQRRERHQAARRCSRRRSPPRVPHGGGAVAGTRVVSRRRGGPGRRGAARPSAPRANQPDRPSLPMTRRQAALATMGLRVCHGRSQQRHALHRSAGRRVAPRAPRFRPPHSHRDRRCDADKSARGQPRHAATSPTARFISAHFHWRKSVPHPVTEYVSPSEPDHDWTARFFSEVQDVSSEEMRSLWGAVLAGEVERKGSTSIRTLQVLKNLDRGTARLFTKLCSSCIYLPQRKSSSVHDARVPSLGGKPGMNALSKYGFSFTDLNRLNECNLIISEYNSKQDYKVNIPNVSMTRFMALGFEFQDAYWNLTPSGDKARRWDGTISGVALSLSGKELAPIVDLDPAEEFAAALRGFFRQKGFSMTRV